MSLLENIVSEKRREVERRKEIISLKDLKKRVLPEPRDFSASLKNDDISIIAEIKRMSPSAGIIREDFDAVEIAGIYEKNGANAVSVLTDKKFFGGSDEYLTDIKKSVNLPVLRKEFIIDEYQIYESSIIGADAVLLIARILKLSDIDKFIKTAGDLGLDCLVEVHSKEELKNVLSTDAKIVGINNRNLDSLEIDLLTSIDLKKMIPYGLTTVSESGIKTREDVRILEDAGFNAVLIGESLMRAESIGDKLRSLKEGFIRKL